MAFQVNKCNNIPESGIGGVKANIFEIGIPLSIEYSNIKKESCAPFILFALSPVYSTTLSQKEEVTERDLGGSSAFRLDPRVEFGTYFPIGGQLCRIGLFFKTGISLTESNPDGLDLDYGRRTSRVGVGGNISIVF